MASETAGIDKRGSVFKLQQDIEAYDSCIQHVQSP